MRDKILIDGPRLRRAVLLVLVAGVPIIFTRFTNDPINVPKLALLTLGVSIVLAVRIAELLQGAQKQGLTRLVVPAAAVLIPLAIGLLAAPYKGWSVLGEYGRYQGLVPYLLIIVAGALIADAFEGEQVYQLAWAFVGAAGVIGAYSLLQFFGADPFEWAVAGRTSTDITATLGNSNFTGGFLAMSLPVAVGIWFYDPDRRTLAIVCGTAAAGGWIVARSQGAWAAGIAGLAVAVGLHLAKDAAWTRIAALAVTALVAVAALGSVVMSLDTKPEPGGRISTVEVRAFAWKAAGDMTADDPILGRGPNSFALLGVQHRSADDAVAFGTNFPDDPHSVFLAMTTSAGLFGAAGFVVLLVWLVLRGWRLGTDPLPAALFGGAIAYVVQSLVSLDEISIRFAFWALIGGFVGSLATVTEAPATTRVRKSKRGRARKGAPAPIKAMPAVIALGLIPLVGLWWSGRLVLADARAHSGLSAFAAGDATGGSTTLQDAIALRSDPYYRWQLGKAAGDAAVETEDPVHFTTSEDAFAYLDDLPHYPGLIAHARALGGWAEIDEATSEDAIAAYEQLIAVDPLTPQLRVEAADVLADAGRFEEARDVLQPAIEIGGDSIAAVWGALAIVDYNLGDLDAAREDVDKAFALDPAEPQAVVVDDALNEQEEQ